MSQPRRIALAGFLSLALATLALGRGYMGIYPGEQPVSLDDRGLDGTGVLVTRVLPDSPAKEGGMLAGDVLVRFNDHRLMDGDDLHYFLRKQDPGDKVSMGVWRDGKEVTLSLELSGPVEENDVSPLWSKAMRESAEDRGFLGVVAMEVSDEVLASLKVEPGYGVLINEVVKESGALKGGVKPGDVLCELDGSPVYSISRLGKLCRRLEPGTEVSLTLYRAGKLITLKATLGNQAESRGWFGDADLPFGGPHLQGLSQLSNLSTVLEGIHGPTDSETDLDAPNDMHFHFEWDSQENEAQ